MAKKAQSAKPAKMTKSVALNPDARFAGTWMVYRTAGNVTINADQLDVTEGGTLVFLVKDETLYVFPTGQYLYAAKL
jgi:hypothetical protein